MSDEDPHPYRHIYKWQAKYPGTFKTDVVGFGPEDDGEFVQVRSHDDVPWILLKDDGMLYTRPLYSFDGVTGVPDTKNAMRPAHCHDALYQLMREGHIPRSARKAADVTFRRHLIEKGFPRPLAWVYYFGVRLLGYPAVL